MTKDASQLELRSITADEYVPWVRSVMLHFGEELVESRAERYKRGAVFDRCLVVLDGERIVGNAAAHPDDISLPHGGLAPCAGVTAVGVAQDWKRRGLLRRLMTRMLDQAQENGEFLASLYASEATIYGRFGFGRAATHLDLDILSSRCAVARPVSPDLATLVDADGLHDQAPGIWDSLRRQRPGVQGLTERRRRLWWDHDDADQRDGFSPRQHAIVPGRGFVTYRWKPSWDQMVPNGEVKVSMLVATDAEAEAALWNLVLDHDLTSRVTAEMQPEDTALPYIVDDASMVRSRHGEHLYLRILDLPAAIAARGYVTDDTLTLEVGDAFRPDNAGRWRIDTSDGSGRAERTDAAPDLALDVADLASTYLGGVRATTLVAAGRVTELTPGAAARLDRLMASDRAPWNPFEF